METSHNKRLSEMAVGVEICSLLLPMTLCASSGYGAPRPPLRQAAGRYVKFALVRCKFIDNALKNSLIHYRRGEKSERTEYL